MPEHRKISTKTPKVKSSALKRTENADNVSLASSDDFKIIDTSHDIQPEFEDGTTRPIFRRKLKKTVVSENSMARLECVVVGIPQPKVLWLKNNRPLKSTDQCHVLSEGNVHILEFPKTKKDDTGLYTARAMNVNGSTISSAELLVGNAQPSSLKKYKEGLAEEEFQTPAYFFQMNSCQVEEGRLARFDCRVVAHPKPEITWMKDGKVVESGDRYKLLNFNNEIYSLLVQNVEMGDTGRYTCWAHNKYGEAMTEAYLNVIALEEQLEDADIAPKFLTKFYDQTITQGLPTTFQCMIAGKPMPVVSWFLNEKEIKSSDNIKIQQEANICSLSIKESKTKEAGKYTCHLKNPLGEALCSAGLTLLDQEVKGVPMLPKFLKRIDDAKSTAGDQMIYEVVVVGEPKPKVSWLYNHKPISETHRRFHMSQEVDTFRLTLKDLRLEDEGKVTCKAVNSEGEVYCSSQLTVKRAPMEFKDETPSFRQKDFDAKYGCAPTFIKKIENTYSPEGKSAKFECKVMGIPEPNVTWYKDNKPLSPGSHYWINRDGGNCTLTIRDVMESDTGQYTCKINNPAGETSSVASLELPGKMKKDSSVDGEYSPFARRFSRDSTKSDHEAMPSLPYDKPSLTDIREESVRLSWLPAYTSTLPPEGRNVKYVIEARELPGFDWHKVATGIHGNTHMLKNLKPRTEYAFRVHAENQFGVSDSTQPVMLSRPKPVEEEAAEKFHVKPHESRVPPKLPSSKPFVTEMGQETVRLAWKPAVAPVAAKKVAPITYRLEAQELPAKDWMPVAHRIRDTSYYLPELKSDRDYNLRVRAENKYGQSDPSESLWIPRATHFPGVPISRPNIVDMEPDSVRVSWQKVDIPSFSAKDEPLLYLLEMQEPPKRDWQQIARDIPDHNYTVKGLTPGQDYRFRVKARTMGGAYGEPSPSTSMYRTLATTRIPIDRLELEDSEPDYEGVRLTWNKVDIPPYHRGEEPLMYMVEISEPPMDEWRPVVTGLPTTRYRVTDLLPDRDYRFRVRGVTPYGVTPPSYSLPVSYRRPTPAPSRPLPNMPQLLYDDSDALRLTWKPPTVDIKRPLRYQIQMQAPQSLDWRPLATGINDTSYRIRGLGPSRDYMFRVIPETSLGPLEPLPPVSLTALPAPRSILPRMPDIVDLQPDSLRLSWQRPYIDSTVPLTYRIDMQEPPSREWRPIATGVPDTQYHVTGLRQNKDYLFRVTPSTPTYAMEPLPYVTLTSLPVRPRLYSQEPRAVEVGKGLVQLSWRPAELPQFARHKLPINYFIEMRTLPSANWEPVARNVHDTTYLVKGLRSDKEYQFRIKAHTDFGSSEPSLPVTVYRKSVPVFPRYEPIVTNLNPDSVVLSWQPATLPGHISHMPMVTYRIEIQDPPERGQWRSYVSNVPKTSYHVTNLRPDRDYLFRVRAEADNTTTEPSMPVYLPRRACPPRMPQEQPYVLELRPDSLKLQWRSVELPSRITDYSPVTYRLEIQELPRSDWMTLAKGIPHTDFHVTNLNPDKDYRFRVRAENDMGISDPTPDVSIKKRAVAPTMRQEEPLIYDIGPSGSFWLSWRPADPSLYMSDSSPVTYTIYVQESPSNTWRPLVRRIPHPFYHVTNLRNDKDYSFRVQAENEFGLSRPTLPIRLLGIKSRKSPVDIPEITDIDDTSRSLRLKWRPRSMTPFNKGPVTYQVERWEPSQRNWTRMASGIRDTNYQVTGLPFDQDHLFRIRAEAEKVLSEPTYPISFNRFRLPSHFPVPRPQLYDVEPDAVRLSWLPLPRGNAQEPIVLPRRFRLELRELPSRDWRPVAHDIPDTNYRVTGLKPRQDYEFRVRGISDGGLGDYTKPTTLYRRPVLPRTPIGTPRLVDVKDDYVDLNWKMVDVPAHSYDEEPLAFLIEAQTPPRYDWMPVARNVRGTSFRISNLQRHQDYMFRIRAEYPSGLSSPSAHIPVYRKPSELYLVTGSHGSTLTGLTSKLVSPLVSTNQTPTALGSKKDLFLAELKRLDTRRKEFQEKVQKFKQNTIKALTDTKSLKDKFLVEMSLDNKLPPPSPRSRRDKFLIVKVTPRIQGTKKKADFGKTLEKFKSLETLHRVEKPVTNRRDISTSVGRPTSPRKLSLDSRMHVSTPLQTPALSSVLDTKSKVTSLPRKPYISTDDSYLSSRRGVSHHSVSDLSYKKRHLVPDRLKYRQMTTDSYTSSLSDQYKVSSVRTSRYKPPERRYFFPRPHSWGGRGSRTTLRTNTSRPTYDLYTSHTSRSSLTSTPYSRDNRHGSLSLIGKSVYHDLYSRSVTPRPSSSLTRSSNYTPTHRESSYSDTSRQARSLTRDYSSPGRYDSVSTSSKLYSTNYSRERTSYSVGPNIGSSRKYSVATDYISARIEYDRRSEYRSWTPDRFSTSALSRFTFTSPSPSFTRSPSRATTRSPSRAKTWFDSQSVRSGSVSATESGYMSRTPSLSHSLLPSRSSSVTQSMIKSRSGSTTDSPSRLRPRSSSAILTGLPPVKPSTSTYKKKDMSVSYTSYLPPTKQTLKQRSSSKDSLLSTESSTPSTTQTTAPQKDNQTTPTKSTAKKEVSRKERPKVIKEDTMKGVPGKQIGVPDKQMEERVEDTGEEEKLSWLRTPSSQTIKHLA